MLVPGEKNIKVQLLTEAVAHVLGAGGEDPPRFQVPLEASVVDAKGDVGLSPQGFQGPAGGGDGVDYGETSQVLRPFPDHHMVGNQPHNPHPQAVFQPVNLEGEGGGAVLPDQILADAPGPQRVQVPPQVVHAVVEVVVAQGHKVVAAAVHHLGKAPGVVQGVVAVGPQGGALEQVPPVDDQGVAVLPEAVGALKKPQLLLLLPPVVGGEEETVEVGGKADAKNFFHSPTPVSAWRGSWRRWPQ